MSTLPSYINPQAWAGYEELRQAKAKKAPYTARARELILAKLARMHAEGIDVNAVLDESVMNGWTGVFEPKPAKAVQQFKTAKQRDHDDQAARIHALTGGMMGRPQQSLYSPDTFDMEPIDAAPRLARH